MARIFILWSVEHAKEILPYQATVTTPCAPAESPKKSRDRVGGGRRLELPGGGDYIVRWN
jgi:hypothetical protein